MIFLVLKAHGALHFGGGVGESTQWIARQGMVVAAGVHVFKFERFMEAALGIGPFEQKAFNFVGGVKREPFLVELVVGVAFQQSANVRRIWAAVFVDHLSE